MTKFKTDAFQNNNNNNKLDHHSKGIKAFPWSQRSGFCSLELTDAFAMFFVYLAPVEEKPTTTTTYLEGCYQLSLFLAQKKTPPWNIDCSSNVKFPRDINNARLWLWLEKRKGSLAFQGREWFPQICPSSQLWQPAPAAQQEHSALVRMWIYTGIQGWRCKSCNFPTCKAPFDLQ